MSFSAASLALLSKHLAAHSESGGLDAMRPREVRRKQGAYFTPEPLVEFVVEEALDAYWEHNEVLWDSQGFPRIKILDPSAGDGRFLFAAARALLRRGGKKASLEAIERHCLIAIERDPGYAESLMQRLGRRENVHCEEALLSGAVANQSVDLVLGNPPYLRSIHLGQSDAKLQAELRGVYAATSHGEWDIYAAFLEQGLAWLRAGGELALVLPSRWWSAQWAAPLRQHLGERAAVRALVDFGAEQVFANATVYASLCFASLASHAEVQVARSSASAGWQLGYVASRDLKAAPWPLLVGASRKLVEALRRAGPPLGELAQISKGAGTNADSVFVISDANTPIEAELLRPLLRGRDVLAFGAAPNWPRVLVPYDEDGQLIEVDRMRSEFPEAFAHLLAHRHILEAREKGRFAGESFYCFGRPQNMRFHGSREDKIVVPDVAKEGRALIDRQSAMVLDSAYAIRVRSGVQLELASLCGILNSRLVGLWLGPQGMTLRGGYTRMKTAYLRNLPIPGPGKALDAIGEAVVAGREIRIIDDLVRRAYQIDSALWGSWVA